MSGLTPKKLAESLVEKHDRFIAEYGDELEKSKQVLMLREKRDQLVHWMEENGSKGKFAREFEDTEREYKGLMATFKPKGQSYYEGLKGKVEENKKARSFWLEKAGGTKA